MTDRFPALMLQCISIFSLDGIFKLFLAMRDSDKPRQLRLRKAGMVAAAEEESNLGGINRRG